MSKYVHLAVNMGLTHLGRYVGELYLRAEQQIPGGRNQPMRVERGYLSGVAPSELPIVY